ncbi:virulence factor TspB C-terminal domain-related protein [Acinetobacter baumannii]
MNNYLSRSVSVVLTQLILFMSLLMPYHAYANTSSMITTSYLGRLQNGYYNFQFQLSNSATGLSRAATKAVSPQSLSKVLRYVVAKRLAAFTALASIAASTGIDYKDSEIIYTPIPGSLADRNIGIDTRDSGFIQVSNLNQGCAIAYPELAWQWSQLDPVGYTNCKWLGNDFNAIQMDLCQSNLTTGCGWTRDIALSQNPTTSNPRSIPDAVALDMVLPQAPVEAPKLVDPTLIPSNILPTEVTEAINELNDGLGKDDIYVPPYVPTAPTDGTATGGYGDGSISLDFPIFCTWASSVCESIDFIKDKVGELSDFFKAEPQQDTHLEFPVDTPVNINTDIKFNGQCPAPLTYEFTYGGQAQSFGIKDFTPFCSMLNDIFKPIVIAVSSFVAVLIIAGVRTNE